MYHKNKELFEMKKVLYYAPVVLLLVGLLLVASCSTNTTQTTKTTQTTQTTQAPTTTVTTAANWWDKFGTPQYGGTLVLGISGVMGINFDVYSFVGADNDYYYEPMFIDDWKVDRNIWSFPGGFIPAQYLVGNLIDTWEQTDPLTITVHLHQGIHWQNKAPVNGREFTADDVQSHYDRLLGTGGGYTTVAPMYGSQIGNLTHVTTTDKYTVVYHFKAPSLQNFYTIADRYALNQIEAPEYVALGGPPAPAGSTTSGANPLQDWHNAVGTGPWILDNFINGSSFNYSKNSNYWKHDPRFPQNQLPYVDKFDVLIIPDSATRLAALRTGKIDSITGSVLFNFQQAADLTKTSPEILQSKQPAGSSGLGYRFDKSPFTDIRVRQAFDMAIDRKGIAGSLYGGTTTGNPAGLFTSSYKGYAYDYADWPLSLKDQYDFNPTTAKQLLADAGYPDGFKTNVVADGADAANLELLQAIKANLFNIGVDMEIRTMDTPTLQAFTRAGKHDQMMSRPAAYTFPPSRTVQIYYSKSSDAIMSGVKDTAFDALVNQFTAATDPAAAAAVCAQVDKYFIEQHMAAQVGEHYNFVAWQPQLKGYSGENESNGQQIDWACMWKGQ